MNNRREMLRRAIDECFREMYRKAQPSADFDALIEGKKNGTIIDTNEDPIYRRYYLSQEEYKYIENKYVEAYRLQNEWIENTKFLEDCLREGNYHDIYVGDEYGIGHREGEKLPPLKDVIGEENAQKVFDYIKEYRNFFKFDRDYSDFSCAVALGASPNSNAKVVEEYWRSHGIPDFTIEERDPESFWYRDEYGDNWKEILDEENAEIEEANKENE